MAREERAGLSETGLQRLLRRVVPGSRDARQTHEELMKHSERRLAVAAASGDAAEKLVATRIRDCPHEYQRWEEEHAHLMQRVADLRGEQAQKTALLSAALALIHRKALFEYLRDRHVCGGDRQRLLTHFHSGNDYAGAFVQEHANYLRSTASYLCVRYIGLKIMRDAAFDGALEQYEEAYAEYFSAFCEAALGGRDEDSNHARNLLVPLKQRVNELRGEILGTTATARSGSWKKLPETT